VAPGAAQAPRPPGAEEMRQLSAIMDKLDNTGAAVSQLSAPERALFERFQQQAGNITDEQIKAIDDKIGRMNKVITEGRADANRLQKETDDALTLGKIGTWGLGAIYSTDAAFAAMRVMGGAPAAVGKAWQGGRAAGDAAMAAWEQKDKAIELVRKWGGESPVVNEPAPVARGSSAANQEQGSRAAANEGPRAVESSSGPNGAPRDSTSREGSQQPAGRSANGEPTAQAEEKSSADSAEAARSLIEAPEKVLQSRAAFATEKGLVSTKDAQAQVEQLSADLKAEPLTPEVRAAMQPTTAKLKNMEQEFDDKIKEARAATTLGQAGNLASGVMKVAGGVEYTQEMATAQAEGNLDKAGAAGMKAIKEFSAVPEFAAKLRGIEVEGTARWIGRAGNVASFGAAGFEYRMLSDAARKGDVHGAIEHGGEMVQNGLQAAGQNDAAEAVKGVRKAADQVVTNREMRDSQQTFNANIDRIRDGLDRTEERMEQNRLWRILLTRQRLRELAQQTAPQ
jgi:hypothetical protein